MLRWALALALGLLAVAVVRAGSRRAQDTGHRRLARKFRPLAGPRPP